MKVAFLDRDGTIIRDYPDEQWKGRKTPEFLDNAFEALRCLRDRGYEIIVVTNQYLIGEGITTPDEYLAFNTLFLKALNTGGIDVLDVFHCPHARSENCSCCKPKPGLIQQALQKYPKIELAHSLLIGDSKADLQLADSLGIAFIGIGLKCTYCVKSIGDIESVIDLAMCRSASTARL